MHPQCCRPATSWVHYTTSYNTQSSVPEDGRDHHLKHAEPIGIINKPLLLQLVGVYIIYKYLLVMYIRINIYLQVYCVKIFACFKQSMKAVRMFHILHAGWTLLHLYRHSGYCRRDKSGGLKGRYRQSVGSEPLSSFHRKKDGLGIF